MDDKLPITKGGFYFYFKERPSEGSAGPFKSFEQARRSASAMAVRDERGRRLKPAFWLNTDAPGGGTDSTGAS